MFAAICSASAHVVAEYYNKLQYDKTDGTMEKQQQQQQRRQTKFDPEPKEAEAASFVDSLINIVVLTVPQHQWLWVHVEQGGRGLQERAG